LNKRSLLILAVFLMIGASPVVSEAPEFTYAPAQQTIFWAPPTEFVAPADTWKPPAGYEKYAQPWSPPEGWQQPSPWAPPQEPEGFIIERRKIPEAER
jgi:hypothetical protein